MPTRISSFRQERRISYRPSVDGGLMYCLMSALHVLMTNSLQERHVEYMNKRKIEKLDRVIGKYKQEIRMMPRKIYRSTNARSIAPVMFDVVKIRTFLYLR